MSPTEPGTPRGAGALSKLRRGRKGPLENVSTLSVASSLDNGEDSGNNLRASMDGAFDKLKDRARKSVDDRRGSGDGSNRLSTLISGKKKLRRKKDAADAERTMSNDSTFAGDSNFTLSANPSERSLSGSGHSSLMTDDYSDNEGQPVRPSLEPRESHAGYLTLSSPLIHAQTDLAARDAQATVPVQHPEATQSTPILPSAETPSITETLATPPSLTRSQSPVEKFKGAFTIPRKKAAGDIDPLKQGGGGAGGLGGLGGLFSGAGGSRRGSVISQAGVAGVEEGAQISKLDLTDPADDQERPQTPQAPGRQRINTGNLPSTPPNLVETPTTLITPPTPTDNRFDVPSLPRKDSKPVATTSSQQPLFTSNPKLSSIESIKHRRAQSSSHPPSKLSNAITAPLTPTVEETKTPGGTLTNPASASGFFTSVFSAAQKAADQLSNSINTSIAQDKKPKETQRDLSEEVASEEVIPGPESQSEGDDSEKRQPAVATLGSGDLSLSHLGIADSTEPSPMTSATDLHENGVQVNDEANNKVEEDAAARAVSAAYEKPVASAVSQAMGGRPMSIASNGNLTLNGDQTPPRSNVDIEGIKRSGSVRSRLSGRRRRHRASSATTGGSTIASAIQASTAALANPGANGAGHRLTGFAVASSKRNKDFHQLFRSVPEDDYLIEDYSAALQRDILLHGRLYVSEGHICFSSNILGWVTNLVISFDEVVSVEKKNTAVIFPNAIVISTLHARNTFASFVARDSTYELLIGIWKISHPNLKSSLNGVTIDDAGTGDKTEKAESIGSDEGTEDGSDDEVYDEDEEEDDISFTEAGGNGSIAGSDIGEGLKTVSRKTSTALLSAGQTNGVPSQGLEKLDAVVTGAAVSADFPGPPLHAPTECSDAAEHYDRPLMDTTIPAPLGKVYSMMFGPASGAFMRKWLVEDQKSRELAYEDDKTGLDDTHKTFQYSYIKPLNAPVGPRQTKCITSYSLEAFDLEKAVSVSCSTQTPDVPSGNIFTTKTKYCLMWGPSNTTRLIANCTIEWTGKSWLRGPIEKGANDGQTQYMKDIVTALKASVTTKPPVRGMARGKGKAKRRKETFDADGTLAEQEADNAAGARKEEANWGLLEPLRGLLEPFVSIFKPLFTSQVIITVLCILVAWLWFSTPRRNSGLGFPGVGTPERLAAYEEIWRREESELWDWLEDKVGLDHLYAPSLDAQKQRQKIMSSKKLSKKMDDKRMNERQVDEAIRVTEERLLALKDAVERKKGKRERVPA